VFAGNLLIGALIEGSAAHWNAARAWNSTATTSLIGVRDERFIPRQ